VSDETLTNVPNAFTPGYGANNEFKIIKRGIATLNYFRIFNRWGNMVFETTDMEKGWDGTYKGVPQPLGVYVYMYEGVTNTGKVFKKQGNVSLLR
jgi:gliding motility-associated-like protein